MKSRQKTEFQQNNIKKLFSVRNFFHFVSVLFYLYSTAFLKDIMPMKIIKAIIIGNKKWAMKPKWNGSQNMARLQDVAIVLPLIYCYMPKTNRYYILNKNVSRETLYVITKTAFCTTIHHTLWVKNTHDLCSYFRTEIFTI